MLMFLRNNIYTLPNSCKRCSKCKGYQLKNINYAWIWHRCLRHQKTKNFHLNKAVFSRKSGAPHAAEDSEQMWSSTIENLAHRKSEKNGGKARDKCFIQHLSGVSSQLAGERRKRKAFASWAFRRREGERLRKRESRARAGAWKYWMADTKSRAQNRETKDCKIQKIC